MCETDRRVTVSKIIREVVIGPATSPFGNMGARVILEDPEDSSLAEEGLLFVWDNSKIHFDKSELIGLSVLEAHRLRHKKHHHV